MSAAPASSTAGWQPRVVRAGAWRVTALLDGTFRLDGGAMWGVVPKALWQRMTPAAADNTIALALRPFLAERGEWVVLVEPGIGDRYPDKWRRIYQLDNEPSVEATLRACGRAPEDVTHVVATHCHWDHAGAQVVERGGRLVPRFPNARHFAPAIEVAAAADPEHVRRGSYRAEDVAPIAEAGLLETWDAERELLPGLRVHPAPGHSKGVSVVTIGPDRPGDPGDTAIFWTDVVPTTHHAQPAYVMAYDVNAGQSYEVRSRWLERAAAESWIGLFYHDPDHAFARLRRAADGRYEAVPLAGDPRG